MPQHMQSRGLAAAQPSVDRCAATRVEGAAAGVAPSVPVSVSPAGPQRTLQSGAPPGACTAPREIVDDHNW
eukprot:7069435-Pyramimonas_sp.AAC.1